MNSKNSPSYASRGEIGSISGMKRQTKGLMRVLELLCYCCYTATVLLLLLEVQQLLLSELLLLTAVFAAAAAAVVFV